MDYNRPASVQTAAAAQFMAMEADYEAARLLPLQAAWMAATVASRSTPCSRSGATSMMGNRSLAEDIQYLCHQERIASIARPPCVTCTGRPNRSGTRSSGSMPRH